MRFKHDLKAIRRRRYDDGSYTWSKSMADSSDGIWNDSQGTLRNWYCRSCEYSLSSYDIPHRFVYNVNYELPFGRGKRFGSSMQLASQRAGWRLADQRHPDFESGQPLIFSQTTNNSFSFGGYQRPDSTGVDARIDDRSIDRWFDTRQFTIAKDYTFGNMSRTHPNLRRDWTRNLDFSMFKNFRFTERWNLQFRAEAFNITNTPIFAAPNLNVESGAFGTITGQDNPARQVQLGLKLLF